MRRVSAGRTRIKCQSRSMFVTAVAEDILPGAVVSRSCRLGADTRRMIEQFSDRDLRLARVTKRLCPWDEVKRRIFE